MYQNPLLNPMLNGLGQTGGLNQKSGNRMTHPKPMTHSNQMSKQKNRGKNKNQKNTFGMNSIETQLKDIIKLQGMTHCGSL